jgi:predicted ABC-class ATPase
LEDAFLIRTEEGRNVSCVDVSPFIKNITKDTRCFSTRNASGATSIASTFQELVETGSSLILLDEDECATNILYLDKRLSNIIKRQTVTPIADLAQDLKNKGISVVVASNGSLDLISSADTVVLVEDYRLYDITNLVKGQGSSTREYSRPKERVLRNLPEVIKVKVRGSFLEVFYEDGGKDILDLSANAQLYEESQVRTIAEALRIRNLRRKKVSDLVLELRRWLNEALRKSILELGEVRETDIIFAINRLSRADFNQQG